MIHVNDDDEGDNEEGMIEGRTENENPTKQIATTTTYAAASSSERGNTQTSRFCVRSTASSTV